MPMIYGIRRCKRRDEPKSQNQLWCRTKGDWVNEKDLIIDEINKLCAYPTYRGANQVGHRIWNKSSTYQALEWGHIQVTGKTVDTK